MLAHPESQRRTRTKVDEGIRAVPGMIGTPLPDINENFRIVVSNRPEDTPVRKETTETKSLQNVHVLAPIQSTSNLLHARQNMSDDSSSSMDNMALLSRDRRTNSQQLVTLILRWGQAWRVQGYQSAFQKFGLVKIENSDHFRATQILNLGLFFCY